MSIYAGSVDDNDSSIIYSGSGWVLVTEDLDWRGTMHSTSVPGSWARFRFTGSRVVVICTIPTGDGQLSRASFQIDDGPAIPISHRTTPPVQWQTQFWNSGPLPFGSHLLTITNLDDDAYFRMDRIDFDPTDGNAPQPSPSVTPPRATSSNTPPSTSSGPGRNTPSISSTGTVSSQSPSSSSTGGSDRSLSSTPTSSNPTTSDSTRSSGLAGATSNSPRPDPVVITGAGDNGATGAEKAANGSLAGIVAGVLGGVLVLILLGIGVYCLRRRRKRIARLQSSEAFDGPRMAGTTEVMPNSFARIISNANESPSSQHLPASQKQPLWANSAPISNAPSSPTVSSSMYTNGQSDSALSPLDSSITGTIADELPSKAALAGIDQRLSLLNPSEAPPPAYHPTNSS